MNMKPADQAPPPGVTWVAFCGASWLWDGGPEGPLLGDMAGPFATWTEAATWALDQYPLTGTPAQQRATMADVVRPVAAPGPPSRAALDGPPAELADGLAAASEGIELFHMALEAEMDVFWAARAGAAS